MYNIDIEEIEKKNKIVDETILKLKKDFIGIDDQIDQVMNHVRTWYVYPKLQSTPIVVCLWGLTGSGKTSLLRKIVKYLDIEKDLVYFNFAEINEMSSYEVESNIEDQLANEKSNRFFVYDEFQYAATLDGHGEEKDNKNGLKPFWELLDTGILHKRMDYRSSMTVAKILSYMNRINSRCTMQIENGVWVNCAKCLESFTNYEISAFSEVFNLTLKDKGVKLKSYEYAKGYIADEDCDRPNIKADKEEGPKLLVRYHILDRIFNMMGDSSIEENLDIFSLYDKISKMNYEEMFYFFSNFYDNQRKGYDLRFNDSIIFVVGNLDEAYTIAFDVNPDMSPDEFNKISKKINIVDIKKALQKRFRNEQIARMGNSHVIYPAFSSHTFREIIELNLSQYGEKVREMCGYEVEYDKSITNLVYNEAVYPTHGTRPIFSTIQEIVKTKLPDIVRNMVDDRINDRVRKLRYKYKSNKVVVSVLDENNDVLKNYSFKVKLRLDNLRKSTKDEEQALCALHESGHFVVYAKLTGEMPEKLVSKTTDNDTGGFLMPSFDDKKIVSKDSLIKEIMVSLGGYVVEKRFFGEDMMSCGASSDLQNATMIASRMIRKYGFGLECGVTTYMKDPSTGGMLISEENQQYINDQIRYVINHCLLETEKIFDNAEWRKMLQKSTEYLSEHSNMPKFKMQEIYDSVNDDTKFVKNDSYYRDCIKKIGE